MSAAYLSKQTIIEHTGNRMLVAADSLLLLRGLQQEKLAVEGEQQELMLLVEEHDGAGVLLRLWKDTGQAIIALLIGYIPQTQHLETQ